MRTQKQIEAAIEEVKGQIEDAKELKVIATFGGAERLLALYTKTRNRYANAIQSLDESNPALDREYAKHKVCLALVNWFIVGMTNADARLEELRAKLLKFNEEMQALQAEKIRLEKKAM